MKLLIISGMPHYLRNGSIVGWGPTVNEIDHLGELFDEVRHIGCLLKTPAPVSALPYSSQAIKFIPVPYAGGKRLMDKFEVALLIPFYLRAILKEISQVDAVHVRSPANVSFIAIVLLSVLRKRIPCWVKYAGNWQPLRKEAVSYSIQRWILKLGLHQGVVTVNGEWPEQRDHIYSFLNPSLTETELAAANTSANNKKLSVPIKILYVGRLDRKKGVDRAIQILGALKERRIAATLDFVGDGEERPYFENLAKELQVSDQIAFHGWVPRPLLSPFFARSHILLLPSDSSEGWPKVLSEGMAYGVVPIAGAISSIPQILLRCQTGCALPPYDIDAYASAIQNYVLSPKKWSEESVSATNASYLFTYTEYLRAVRNMFQNAWNISLK